MSPMSSPDKNLRRGSNKKSFIGGSFIGQNFADQVPETEDQKREREKKEFMESFTVMDKEEASKEMKKKNFQDFLGKTSRIIERCLDNQFDVIGDFFADDED